MNEVKEPFPPESLASCKKISTYFLRDRKRPFFIRETVGSLKSRFSIGLKRFNDTQSFKIHYTACVCVLLLQTIVSAYP